MSSELQTRNHCASNSEKEADFLAIPSALVAYHSKILYNTYFILENQLSSFSADKESCEKLECIIQRVFNAWVALGYRQDGGDNVGCSEQDV